MWFAIAFLALLFVDLPGSKLFDPDETRYAEIPREMVQAGDWRTITLNGMPYFEKPPLLYWLNAASMHIFGETTWAARLPTRLAAAGTVALLIINVGPWAGLLYISAMLAFALGRINLTDGLLSFLLTWTFFNLRNFLAARESGSSAHREALLLGIAASLAMLAKGLIAIVLPGLVLLVWVAVLKRWRSIGALLFSWAPAVFILITVPTFMFIEKYNPGFSHFFFIREHFQRYSSDIHERTGPLLYFVPVLLGGFLPWTPFFLSTLTKKIKNRPDDLYFALWALVPFAFFSLSHSKLIPYVLPCFPAMAALTASAIASGEKPLSTRLWMGNAIFITGFAIVGVFFAPQTALMERVPFYPQALAMAFFMVAGAWAAFFLRHNIHRALLAMALAWFGVLSTVVVLAPRLSAEYSDYWLADKIAILPENSFVCYNGYSHGVRWYLNRNIAVTGFKGELASDGVLPADRFWPLPEFWKRWNSAEKLTVYVPRRGKSRRIDDFRLCPRLPVVLAENHHSLLIANFDPDPSSRRKPGSSL